MIIRAYFERVSMEGIKTRSVFGVNPKTLAKWLKERGETLPKLEERLEEARPDDILELDELWSYVQKKTALRAVFLVIDVQIAVVNYGIESHLLIRS